MENFTHLNVSDIQNWNIGNSSKNSNAEQVTLDIVAASLMFASQILMTEGISLMLEELVTYLGGYE